MSDAPEQPQIYLVSPPEVELSRFPDQLAACLDAVEVACLRLALSSEDEDHIARVADATREVVHARDIAIVIDTHANKISTLFPQIIPSTYMYPNSLATLC